MKQTSNLRPRMLFVIRSFILHNNKILLIKRSSKDNWEPGKWEIPGGKLDEGQDISMALEREVFEETGIVCSPINRLAYFESSVLDKHTVSKKQYIGLTYVQLVGISLCDSTKVTLSSEHEDYRWVKLSEIEQLDISSKTKKPLSVLRKLLTKSLKKS